MNILQAINRRMANLIGHILRINFPLKHVTKGKTAEIIEDVEEDISSYGIALRKTQHTGN
jgi:Tfp pilus assembly ATPase PilU